MPKTVDTCGICFPFLWKHITSNFFSDTFPVPSGEGGRNPPPVCDYPYHQVLVEGLGVQTEANQPLSFPDGHMTQAGPTRRNLTISVGNDEIPSLSLLLCGVG